MKRRRFLDRVARKTWRCSCPTSWVWCEGQIKPGQRYVAVVDSDGATSRLTAILCRECRAVGAQPPLPPA